MGKSTVPSKVLSKGAQSIKDILPDVHHPEVIFWINKYLDEILTGTCKEGYMADFLLKHKSDLTMVLKSRGYEEGKEPEKLNSFLKYQSTTLAYDALKKYGIGTGNESDYLIVKDHYAKYKNTYIEHLSPEFLDSLNAKWRTKQALLYLRALSTGRSWSIDRSVIEVRSSNNVATDAKAKKNNMKTEKSLFSIEFLKRYVDDYKEKAMRMLQDFLDKYPELLGFTSLPEFSFDRLRKYTEKSSRVYLEPYLIAFEKRFDHVSRTSNMKYAKCFDDKTRDINEVLRILQNYFWSTPHIGNKNASMDFLEVPALLQREINDKRIAQYDPSLIKNIEWAMERVKQYNQEKYKRRTK